jgi:hypothetical protein
MELYNDAALYVIEAVIDAGAERQSFLPVQRAGLKRLGPATLQLRGLIS